jgi:hypothetical protein
MTKPIESILSWFVTIIFTAAAGFFVWFLITTCSSHYRAREWEPVPARVQNYDLRISRSRSGTSMLPTTRERLVTSYTYTFDNNAYSGSRVDFSLGSDNFSNERRSDQMAALRTGAITIYVDPRRPRESVFDRSLPSGQIVFAIVFLLFPCGIGTAATLGWVSAGLSKLGIAQADRYFMPFLGMFHSAPDLYPILYDPGSIGFLGWVILSVFLALLLISIRAVWRRIQDPSLGSPQWSNRFKR